MIYLICGEMRSEIEFLETFLDVRPEVVHVHGPALVVDVVNDIDDPGAEERSCQVKVVHEAVQHRTEFDHLLWTEFIQMLNVITARMFPSTPSIHPLDFMICQLFRSMCGSQDGPVAAQPQQVAPFAIYDIDGEKPEVSDIGSKRKDLPKVRPLATRFRSASKLWFLMLMS